MIFDRLCIDLLGHLGLYLNNKYIVRWLSTCTILYRIPRPFALTEFVDFDGVKDIKAAGFFATKVVITSAWEIIDVVSLNKVKELDIWNPNVYHSERFLRRFPSSIVRATLNFSLSSNVCRSFAFLPRNLVQLDLHWLFNQSLGLGLLPPGLHTLRLGDSFNRRLAKGALPPTLKRLRFGYAFNQKIIPGSLPNSIETLVFSSGFKENLNAQNLPSQLKDLTRVDVYWPNDQLDKQEHLTHLCVPYFNVNQLIDLIPLPRSLTHVSCSSGVAYTPFIITGNPELIAYIADSELNKHLLDTFEPLHRPLI